MKEAAPESLHEHGPSPAARRLAWRHPSLPAFTVTGATLALVMVTYVLAFNLPVARQVDARGPIAALDYASEPFLSLPSLQQTFLAQALGESALRLLTGQTPQDAALASGSLRRSGDGPRNPDDPGQPPPDGFDAPVQGPDMRIAMTADKSEVRPGETVTYRITATNSGRRSSTAYSILSHVPDHTTLVAGAECGGEGVALQPNPGSATGYTLCADVAGPPAPGDHGFRAEGARPLEPGTSLTVVFKVQVDPNAPQGTRLTNHAHVRGPDFPQATSPEVSTRVVLS